MKSVALGEVVNETKTWNPSRVSEDEIFDYIDIGAIDTLSKKIVASKKVSCSEAADKN
jgi:hypothetical protein